MTGARAAPFRYSKTTASPVQPDGKARESRRYPTPRLHRPQPTPSRLNPIPEYLMSRFFLAVALTLTLTLTLSADDWPQWLGPKRDGVWREAGIVETFPKNGHKELWRVPVGIGYAGPAVTQGKVFVIDLVPAKDAKLPESGFEKGARVPGNERILCLDQKTGKPQWEHRYPIEYRISYAAGPR